jgi:hypothetical protein
LREAAKLRRLTRLDTIQPLAAQRTPDTTMLNPMPASDVLNREFLEIRAKILQIAASFDRLDRGEGSVDDDPRMTLIREALDILQSESSDRAEQVQLLFSREYDSNWRKSLGVK